GQPRRLPLILPCSSFSPKSFSTSDFPPKLSLRLFALPVVFVPNFHRQSGWLPHLDQLRDLARPSTCMHSVPH
ncbi:hypothetical protein LINGRAPRIM_LOCUS2260, partial [Linum grandiflorum]